MIRTIVEASTEEFETRVNELMEMGFRLNSSNSFFYTEVNRIIWTAVLVKE